MEGRSTGAEGGAVRAVSFLDGEDLLAGQVGAYGMDMESFVEGPLLRLVFVLFTAAVVARLLFFIMAVLRSRNDKGGGVSYVLQILGRFLLPYHKASLRKPLYASLRYIFHLCLVVVPIWLGGHVVLWAESRFEWDWLSLPDSWADILSLVLLILAGWFFIRRIVFKEIRVRSSFRDFAIIFFTALPFLTGYFLSHGTLDGVGFLGDNIRTIHVLSGEIMILMAAFLFCRTTINPDRCIGCAACELACPTGTIESRDEGKQRIFDYSHYQCICCASCVMTCPEDAAELRHRFSPAGFFKIAGKYEIRKTDLFECERCGALFAPEPQMDKAKATFPDRDYLRFCPECRKTNMGDLFQKLSPWHRKTAQDRERGKNSLFIRSRDL